MSHSCPRDILSACVCLLEQSEEDIDVAALGKQQPENIPNPLYESTPSAPQEPSCDYFMVSLPLHLGTDAGGVQESEVFQHVQLESFAPRKAHF